MDDVVSTSPVLATHLGVRGSDHLWGDGFGLAGVDRSMGRDRRFRGLLTPHLGDSERGQRLAARVMLGRFEESERGHEAGDHFRTLRHLGSPYHRLMGVFSVMPTENPEDRDNVVERLITIDHPLADYRELLTAGIDRDITVAGRQTRSIIEQTRRAATDPATFSRLVNELEKNGLGSSKLVSATERARVAIGEFGEWLEHSYLPHSIDEDAVGPEVYARSADRLVGLDVDPHEAYQWGWGEFHRLRAEMVRVAEKIDPGAGVDAVKEYLENDPSATVQGTDALLSFVENLLVRAVDELSGVHFEVPDRIRRVTVHLDPPGSPLGVHYVRPSEDFSRPGAIWYSVGDQKVFPIYQHVSTTYHEGFPGHHLQIATAMSQTEELSRYQRVLVFYPGYAEGWAMYAEVLMGELGYLADPRHYFGMLAKQMYRASRIVVDIGLHLGKRIDDSSPIAGGEPWTFETAVEFMTVYGFRTPAQGRAEVLRYLGWPGQAIGYKLGEREILSIRDDLRSVGGSFDMKQFHSTLLGHGPMRLDLLREVVVDRMGR